MKKIILVLVTCVLVLSTNSIYASETVDVNAVIDEVINLSEVYKKGGVTSEQLLELMAMSQQETEVNSNEYNLKNFKLFNPSDYNLDIPKIRDGDMYDGNPPYSDQEQKNRMQYISKNMINHLLLLRKQ